MADALMSGLVVRVYTPGGFGYVKEKSGTKQYVFQFRQVHVKPDAGKQQNEIQETAPPVDIVEGMKVRFSLDNTGRVETVVPKAA